MKWNRRAVLRSGAAVLPTLMLPSRAYSEGFSADVLTLVLDAISWPGRSPLAARVIEAFVGRSLPIAAALEGWNSDNETPEMLRPEQDAVRSAGLLEVVALLPEVAGLHRYGQMRAAADHRAALSTGPADASPVVTLVARSGEDGLDWSAFRSAGFRVVLVPDGVPRARPEVIGRGQLRLIGGAALSTSAGGASLLEQAKAALAGGPSVLLLPLADLAGPRAEEVVAQIEEFAAWLFDKVAMGELVMLRPLDHLLQSGELIQQQVVLVVDVDQASEEAATDLVASLDEAGIPFTLAAPEDVLQRLGRPRDCRPWPREILTPTISEERQEPAPIGARCVVAPLAGDLPASAAARVVLMSATEGATLRTGLREDGRFWAVAEPWSIAELWQPASPLVDRVLQADADSYGTPQRRSALVRALVEAAAGGRVRFWSLEDWSHHILAPEPLLTRFWNARSRLVTDPPRAAIISDVRERDELMRDASAAWRYIERHTDARTGICATTVEGEDREQVNVEATLWDVGSQIQGILGAARLELIPRQECIDRITLIARNIPSAEVGGLRFPPAIFHADDLRPVRSGDFDLCDLGRFLIALDSAVDYGVLPQEAADDVWKLWAIDAAIHDGQIHTFDNGRWRDITWSHCTDYIAPAFRRRGWSVQGIFPETNGAANADESLQILYAAAAAGSYGTEPGLLAKIETGASEAERLLALVLFDAQLSWYETHGEMKSVSETPLNFPPWFSYQGLVLEEDGPQAWVVNTRSNDPRFQTEEFRRRALLIGSKSAYLWKANYPHPYSDRLVGAVRNKCRNDENGFAVGVFVSSLESMGPYYDVNTNGIILSAIAHLMQPP